jgi:hypothetical protein
MVRPFLKMAGFENKFGTLLTTTNVFGFSNKRTLRMNSNCVDRLAKGRVIESYTWYRANILVHKLWASPIQGQRGLKIEICSCSLDFVLSHRRWYDPLWWGTHACLLHKELVPYCTFPLIHCYLFTLSHRKSWLHTHTHTHYKKKHSIKLNLCGLDLSFTYIDGISFFGQVDGWVLFIHARKGPTFCILNKKWDRASDVWKVSSGSTPLWA